MPKRAAKRKARDTPALSDDFYKEEAFRVVRSLPVDLPPIDFFSWCDQNEITGGIDELATALEDWKSEIKATYPAFAEYCEKAFSGDMNDAIRVVEKAQQLHNFAYTLARYADVYRSIADKGSAKRLVFGLPPEDELRVSLEPAGGVDIVLPWYIKAFQDADKSKVRTCSYCGKVFWQSRKDKIHCSKICSSAARVDRLRSDPDQRARINENRREVYRWKKDGLKRRK